jgi:esterase/lipase superfamily enzyme
LDGDSNDKLDSVYFIAPDLAAKMFLSALPDISAKSKNIAVYMNRRDRVLGASSLNSLFELSSEKKLGKANVKAPGIDFIDYEQIAMPRGIGHYVPFEHLGSMIRTRMPFSDKSQENKYFLMRRTSIEKQK